MTSRSARECGHVANAATDVGTSMMDPFSSAWLLGQAGALALRVLAKAGENVEDEAAKGLSGFVVKLAKRPFAASPIGDLTSEAGVSSTRPAVDLVAEEQAVVDVVEQDGDHARELERRFGVDLSSALPPDRTGTDATLVRASEAVLWRLAVLAAWEQHPIAVSGALQGREWLTLCVPRQAGVLVSPSAMWKAADGATVGLRRIRKGGPVEFFVKQVRSDADLKAELDAVNKRLSVTGSPPPESARPTQPSKVEGWHRVDALYARWIALEPDEETARAVAARDERSYEGLRIAVRNFDTRPFGYDEYPDAWQVLLDVDVADGLAALLEGIDQFADESSAVRSAGEALLT